MNIQREWLLAIIDLDMAVVGAGKDKLHLAFNLNFKTTFESASFHRSIHSYLRRPPVDAQPVLSLATTM
jgi:hypothetical protein